MTSLLLGASASGIAWAAGASPLWTAVIGGGLAVLIWFGARAWDWITDLVDALTRPASKSAAPHPNCGAAPTKENTMTERPYTESGLRAVAARVHETSARDSDHRVSSAVKRQWGAQLDADQLDEAGDALITVLDRTADTSRWAVDLGNDGLKPHPSALDAGDGPRFRVHFAFAPDMSDDDRADIVGQFAAFMTHGLT
jgi:hypothetical protein